jgi:hypothetical protein
MSAVFGSKDNIPHPEYLKCGAGEEWKRSVGLIM